MALFTGVGVALVTLFREDGALDAPATADLAAQLAGLGVRCVLVAGTTGEAAALTADERDALVGAVRAAVPADVPVLAGTGAPTGRQAAELTERACAAARTPSWPSRRPASPTRGGTTRRSRRPRPGRCWPTTSRAPPRPGSPSTCWPTCR